MLKRFWKKIQQRFDRDFYRGDGFQFVWLFVFAALTALFWLAVSEGTGVRRWRVIELIMDPGAFVGSKDKGNVWLQLLISLSGLVVFTGFIISTIGNFLARRTNAYAKGNVIYGFCDHILVLGSGSQTVDIIRSLSRNAENAKRDIVIQTSRNAVSVREFMDSQFPVEVSRNIHVVYGSRNLRPALRNLNVADAYEIYVVGEDDEEMHDALNLEAWKHIRDICRNVLTDRILDCYLVLDRLSSERIFHFKSGSGSEGNLHLNVICSSENAAQRVLVSQSYILGRRYPSLDRDGIGPDSDVSVHLVIIGMTQMAYSMAMTAAHICHFPNFVTRGRRTRITFIMPEIKREMDYFMGHFSSLMELSYAEYRKVDPSGNHLVMMESFYPEKCCLGEGFPDPKGFLDVEWEFIDGGIESPAVRGYIDGCVTKDGDTEYLTMAICGLEPEADVAQALYLPLSVFEKKIPVFVYQKHSGEVLRTAEDIDRYSNLYPFGMKCDCLDPQFKARLEAARRVSWVYEHPSEEIPCEDVLKTYWAGIGYALQQSNIHVANTLPIKLRSIANGCSPDLLSVVEHNRWNVERLITGFRALPESVRSGCRSGHVSVSKSDFMHMDIAPYEELSDESKKYDAQIINNIHRIINQ